MKAKIILIIVGIVAVAAIVAFVVFGIVGKKSTPEESVSSSAQPSASSYVEVREGEKWAAGIAGGESLMSINEDELGNLMSAVEAWGNKNDVDTSDLRLVRNEADNADGQALFFQVGDTQRYIVAQERSDKSWGVIKLVQSVDGINDDVSGDAWKGDVPKSSRNDVDLSQQDRAEAPTDLTTTSMNISPNETWPISYEQARQYVPGKVLDVVQSDLNRWLEPRGKSVSDPLNIMVYKKDVKNDGKRCEFYLLVYITPDQPIVKCSYDLTTLEPQFELVP